MSFADYDALKTSIAGWLKRPGDAVTTAQIPDFITLAEAKFNARLRTSWQVSRATAPLDEEREELPAGFLSMISLALDTNPVTELVQIAPEDYPVTNATPGTPTRYAIEGEQLHFWPPPASGGLTLTMSYYAAVPALSASATTNWLLTRSPGLYLYGALMEAAPYLREDARVATWAALYQQELDALTNASARYSRGALRLNARII